MGQKISASKKRLQALGEKLNGLLSVDEVVNKILISLKKIPVRKF